MDRYLEAIKPIVTEAGYERTCTIVEEFKSSNGPGPRLQEILHERREMVKNWAYVWWIKDMYLNCNLPLPINSNPGMVFPPQNFKSAHDMARFAARMVGGILDMKEVLDRKALQVERTTTHNKGSPMCMAQYYRVLTSYRAPGIPQDVLISTLPDMEHEAGRSTPPLESEIIIVACRNQLYSLEVKTPKHGRMTEDEITQQLHAILSDAPVASPPPPIGVLTSETRDTWAQVYKYLLKDGKNSENIKIIQKSLMMVCFDEPLPASYNCSVPRSDVPEAAKGHIVDNRDETNMCHQMLHGGGCSHNGANRWFDITVQLIVSSDGVCGLCYEHSPSEGVAVIRIIEESLKKTNASPLSVPEAEVNRDVPRPKKLEWNVDSYLQRFIDNAAFNMDRLVENLDFYVYRFVGYGKNFIKGCGVSPDAYLQLSLQLTYYRMYHRLVASYESSSTRRFLLGRVDCIRSATSEALNWVTAMCQDESGTESEEDVLQAGKKVTFSLIDAKKKLELFNIAIAKQTEIMTENIAGQGIDIHLLGLRELAKELNEPTPQIFKDESYKIANHFILSTSQVATSSDSFMGYGPVVADGYGASYNPHPDYIVFCLSAFNACKETSTLKFSRHLEESLEAMKQMYNK